jgi:hypothetical protein
MWPSFHVGWDIHPSTLITLEFFYFILPSSPNCLLVKKISVFVTLFKPVDTRSLHPKHLLLVQELVHVVRRLPYDTLICLAQA